MKRFLIISLIFVSFISSVQSSPDAIVGVWKTKGDKYMVRIDKVGQFYQGRIIWHLQKSSDARQPVLDVNNPDERMRLHPLRGTRMLAELSYNMEKSKWLNGIHYNPETGELFHCEIVMKNEDEILVTVFFNTPGDGYTETWKRQPV
ncbi:MAG: DUF2147 domain-containing protein [Cyclobacteriaceae bacterium]|nr:DUF2147 domain-containing protein [Cyclobacteriaceae bacterium]